MSQFDFPRINFHGTILLDTPTANNGVLQPTLTIYDQGEAQVCIPPRVYLTPAQVTQVQKQFPNLKIIPDGQYVLILPISDADIFNQWATVPLGTFGTANTDQAYWGLYTLVSLTGSIPGYWNYFGDLSMTMQNVLVNGITIPNPAGGVQTFTPQNQQGCPPQLADMLGATFSFNTDFFAPGSRTSAYLSDVDSMGQMCTQIFYGNAGLYKTGPSGNITFFSGKPCKSTGRWMNLTRVLNWANMVPMGGSASFYSMIALSSIDNDAKNIFETYSGETVNALFMKLILHEVYEVRNPDYALMPTQPLGSNQTTVPKNPARASITGSICPWKINDLKTSSICRIMKSSYNVPIDTTAIPDPVPKGTNTPIGIPSTVNLAPVFFNHNTKNNLLSLDIINTINEYGTNPGNFPVYGGNGDIAPFTTFINYDFGEFDLYFKKDNGPFGVKIGSFNSENDYNMNQFLATGGMVDIPITAGQTFSGGSFYLTLLIGSNYLPVLQEDNVFITTDQQGTYAEQNQVPANLYMSDGLPKIPCTMRAFYRGIPIPNNNPKPITIQTINFTTGQITNTSASIYDGYQYTFPVNNDGCMTLGFVYEQSELLPSLSLPNLIAYAMRACMIVNRVLSAEPQLQPYINKQQPITWDVVYDNVFQLFHALYPVMNVVVPFNQANWSDPTMLNVMLQLIDETNWGKPLYMPITRELSQTQRKLLQMWAQQILNPGSNKTIA